MAVKKERIKKMKYKAFNSFNYGKRKPIENVNKTLMKNSVVLHFEVFVEFYFTFSFYFIF